jgi:parallel beta-helix repeat protein
MRYIYQDVVQDIYGGAIQGATVTIYLAGTTDAVDVYAALAGGAAVNSVLTDTSGQFSFYVDDSEYTPTQRFKIVVSKSPYVNDTIDYIKIIPDETYVYYVDATATDQGAATSEADRSLKDLIDSIGTSKSATIILPHSGSGNTTTYTVTTAETVPANITLKVESGAILSLAGAFTVNGPIEAGPYRIFDGTISNLTLTGQMEINACWGGGIPDGSTDQTTDIDNLISACPEGSTVIFPTFSSSWKGNFTLSVEKMIVEGMGTHKTPAIPNSNAAPVFEFEGDWITLRGFNINGNGAGTSVYGVRVDRVASGVASSGFTIEECRIQNFTNGVYIVNNYYGVVRHNKINDVTYGILGRNACNVNTFEENKISVADYGIAILNVAGTDTNNSNTNVIHHNSFEVFNAGGVGIQLWNISDNSVEYNYFEDVDWPVLEAGGPITAVHNGGNNAAFLTDSKGRDFVKMGVATGDTVYNRTDGSSGTISAIGNGAATNDKLTITLSGGSEDDFDNNDYCVVDLHNTNTCYLRNSFRGNHFSTIAGHQALLDGISSLASVIGDWAYRKNGDYQLSKTDASNIAAGTETEIDFSSNYSAFTDRPLLKVLCSVMVTNDGTDACYFIFKPAGGSNSIDPYLRVDIPYDADWPNFAWSGLLEIPLNSDFKTTYVCDNQSDLRIRLHAFLH